MEFLDKLKNKKKKKKKSSSGQFEKIVVSGKSLPILNFYLFTAAEDKKQYIELASIDELPELHYSEVEMEVYLTTKKLNIKVAFDDAFPKGRFKIYKFLVLEISEYYI